MRRTIVAALLGLLALCLAAAAISGLLNRKLPATSAEPGRLDEMEKGLLAEAVHLRQEAGSAVWPGWEAADIPTLVYNEAYAFLVGYPNPPAGWVKVPQQVVYGSAWEVVSADTFNGQPYYRQPLPATGDVPESFTVVVGERWVASLATKEWMRIKLIEEVRSDLPPVIDQVFPYGHFSRLLLAGSDHYIAALLHESFHAYVGMVAPERLMAAETAAGRIEPVYPWDRAAHAEAWEAELALLAQAVRVESGEEADALARQFLQQRQQRRSQERLSAEQIDYERQREWLEGLAKYVELEVWRQAAATGSYRPLSILDDDEDFNGYAAFEQQWEREASQFGQVASGRDTRFYYTGWAQATLLDRLMPGWKAQALEPGVFLETLLQRALE